MNTITCLAPAKINLFLHITARRIDGYHCLQTIFQFLDYCDTLHFQLRNDAQLHCDIVGITLPHTENLAWRAAQLLQKYTQTSLGVEIYIDKKIPMGGGLGGGSSDAATTLLALNQLWQLHLTTTQLAQLGLQLGADVPIFVYGYAAWAEGVGEKLTPVELPQQWYLVIHPGCHVSTREIFSAEDLTRNMQPITMDDFLSGQGINVCESVVCRRYPAVKHALNWLNQHSPARMTGTGSCIFASFATQEQAQWVLKQLPSAWSGFTAKSLHKSPAFSSIEKI